MEEKRRITAHNGRKGKNGVYSAKHNDRNFELENAEHIDYDRLSKNIYWHRYEEISRGQSPKMSFEDAEKRFYEETFEKTLEEKNERYRAQRHPERCQTMDEYRTNLRYCPEETLFYLGKKDFDTDPEILWEIVTEHMNWLQEKYPCLQPLDAALHMDEEGAPHVHLRCVWVAHDKNGNLCVGQNQALKEMGVELPDPSKKEGHYNNPKMTFTRDCRENLLSLCEERGIEIERVPQDPSKSGKNLLDYQAQQAEERFRDAEARASAAEMVRMISDMNAEAADRRKEAAQAEAEKARAEAEEQERKAAQHKAIAREAELQKEKNDEELKESERLIRMRVKNLQTLDDTIAQRKEELERLTLPEVNLKKKPLESDKSFRQRVDLEKTKQLLADKQDILDKKETRLAEKEQTLDTRIGAEVTKRLGVQRKMYESQIDALKQENSKLKEVIVRFQDAIRCVGKFLGAEGKGFIADLVKKFNLPGCNDEAPRKSHSRSDRSDYSR